MYFQLTLHHHLYWMNAKKLYLKVDKDRKHQGCFKDRKGNRKWVEPVILCTLQVFRSISLSRFSCSSDSFSFWTKLFMCSGKSSTDKYSGEMTSISNNKNTHLLQDKWTRKNLDFSYLIQFLNQCLTCIPWGVFQSINQHICICRATWKEDKDLLEHVL